MVAGFVAGWMEKKDYEHAFHMGIAAGSASAFSENLATKEEIEAVYGQITGKITGGKLMKKPSMDEWLKKAKADEHAANCGMYLFHNGVGTSDCESTEKMLDVKLLFTVHKS